MTIFANDPNHLDWQACCKEDDLRSSVTIFANDLDQGDWMACHKEDGSFQQQKI